MNISSTSPSLRSQLWTQAIDALKIVLFHFGYSQFPLYVGRFICTIRFFSWLSAISAIALWDCLLNEPLLGDVAVHKSRSAHVRQSPSTWPLAVFAFYSLSGEIEMRVHTFKSRLTLVEIAFIIFQSYYSESGYQQIFTKTISGLLTSQTFDSLAIFCLFLFLPSFAFHCLSDLERLPKYFQAHAVCVKTASYLRVGIVFHDLYSFSCPTHCISSLLLKVHSWWSIWIPCPRRCASFEITGRFVSVASFDNLSSEAVIWYC